IDFGTGLYCDAPSQGAVAQLVRVPVCHTGGRGFEPRQPRLNPPRGTTHPAPSATAGGAFVFGEGRATASYHVPVLADAVRAWADGSRRAVDATVGGGGHAALLRAAGAEVLAVDRDPEAIAAARARLGEDGIRYSTGLFGSAKVLGTIQTFRPDRILLDLGVSSHQLDDDARGFTFRPGAARAAGRARRRRPARRDHLPLGRGPHRQAHVSRLEQGVRLPAASARVHLPRAPAGSPAHAQADRSRGGGAGRQSPGPLGAAAGVRGGRRWLRVATGWPRGSWRSSRPPGSCTRGKRPRSAPPASSPTCAPGAPTSTRIAPTCSAASAPRRAAPCWCRAPSSA